jgi:uncharacterized protein (TIGR00255 family)
MTGFGQAEKETPLGLFHVEIRGVNNRFLELQIRQPRFLANLEQSTKKEISATVSRGSLSVFISCDHEDEKGQLTWDKAAVGKYLSIFREIKDQYKLEGGVSLSHLLQFSDFIKSEIPSYDDAKLWQCFSPVVATAVQDFQRSREQEAKIIVRDLKKMLKELKGLLLQVEKRAPMRVKQYAEELNARIAQLLSAPPDPQKLATEVALMAERLDISEECARLNAHIEKFSGDLDSQEPVGKRLNFLLQEMNREANTIGSKANDTEISHLSVTLKEVIEKIREQIQNIE